MAPTAQTTKKISGKPGPVTTGKPKAMDKPAQGSGKMGGGKPAAKGKSK